MTYEAIADIAEDSLSLGDALGDAARVLNGTNLAYAIEQWWVLTMSGLLSGEVLGPTRCFFVVRNVCDPERRYAIEASLEESASRDTWVFANTSAWDGTIARVVHAGAVPPVEKIEQRFTQLSQVAFEKLRCQYLRHGRA